MGVLIDVRGKTFGEVMDALADRANGHVRAEGACDVWNAASGELRRASNPADSYGALANGRSVVNAAASKVRAHRAFAFSRVAEFRNLSYDEAVERVQALGENVRGAARVDVRHLCGNKYCVRHVVIGSPQGNSLDGRAMSELGATKARAIKRQRARVVKAKASPAVALRAALMLASGDDESVVAAELYAGDVRAMRGALSSWLSRLEGWRGEAGDTFGRLLCKEYRERGDANGNLNFGRS